MVRLGLNITWYETPQQSIYVCNICCQRPLPVRKTLQDSLYQAWPTTRATGATFVFTLWPRATGFGRPVVVVVVVYLTTLFQHLRLYCVDL
jgi:hypothetical protein